jgi:hypothetical protein
VGPETVFFGFFGREAFSPGLEPSPELATGALGAPGPLGLLSHPTNEKSMTATTDTRMDHEDIDKAPVVNVGIGVGRNG